MLLFLASQKRRDDGRVGAQMETSNARQTVKARFAKPCTLSQHFSPWLINYCHSHCHCCDVRHRNTTRPNKKTIHNEICHSAAALADSNGWNNDRRIMSPFREQQLHYDTAKMSRITCSLRSLLLLSVNVIRARSLLTTHHYKHRSNILVHWWALVRLHRHLNGGASKSVLFWLCLRGCWHFYGDSMHGLQNWIELVFWCRMHFSNIKWSTRCIFSVSTSLQFRRAHNTHPGRSFE